MRKFLLGLILTVSVLSQDYPEAWGMSESFPEAVTNLQLETLDLGKTPMEHLREASVCASGKICSFRAKILNHMRSRTFNGHETATGKGVAMPASVLFDISSECGTPSHNFYRMDVTKFKVGRKSVTAFLQYPLYFDQNKKTGKIEHVYFSGREVKSVRATKQTMLLQLAKLVHPSAIEQARTGAARVSYLFIGNNDLNGKYVARHTLETIGNGDLGLTESISFNQGKISVNGKLYDVKDKRLSMRQKKRSKTRLSATANFLELLEKDVVQIGHDDEFIRHAAVANESPRIGSQTAKVNTNIQKLKTATLPQSCSTPENEAVNIPIKMTHFLKEVHKRHFRAPLTSEDWGDDDETPREAYRHLKRAREMIRRGEINFSDLVDCVTPKTAVHVANLARKKFEARHLSEKNLRLVVGALSGVRTNPAYNQLLQFMHDMSLPAAVREEAVISMIHSDEDRPAPGYVINSVSRIAHNSDDPISGSARLLLGNLIKGHPGTPLAKRHLRKLHVVLKAHVKNTVRDIDVTDDASNLIHTFGNAGEAASPYVSDLEEFLSPEFHGSIRRSAADALNSIAPDRFPSVISDMQETFDGELGPSQRKPLVKINEIIYGNKDVEIKAVADLGIKYGGHEEGGFGTGSLHGRILDFKKDLATITFNSGAKRKDDASGAEGSMEFTMKIAGGTVAKKNLPLDNGNVMHGGQAPSTMSDAVTPKPPPQKEWNRVLTAGTCRCGPATVKFKIEGMVGYEIGWAGWINAITSINMEEVKAAPEGGKASSCSTLQGGAIKGKINVKVVSATCPGCKVGFEGSFMLFHGKLYNYCIVDNNMGQCKVDVHIDPQRGKWRLYGKCFAPAMERTMIEWEEVERFKNLENKAYGPLVNGNMNGYPDTGEDLEIGLMPSSTMVDALTAALQTPEAEPSEFTNKPVLDLA